MRGTFSLRITGGRPRRRDAAGLRTCQRGSASADFTAQQYTNAGILAVECHATQPLPSVECPSRLIACGTSNCLASVNETPFAGSTNRDQHENPLVEFPVAQGDLYPCLVRAQTRREQIWLCSQTWMSRLPTIGSAAHAANLVQADYAFIFRGAVDPGFESSPKSAGSETRWLRNLLAKHAPTDTSRPRFFLAASKWPLAYRTASEFVDCRRPKHLAGRTCLKTDRTINSCVLFTINRSLSSW